MDTPHVPPVGPVTTITSARIKTAKDDVDVLELIPKLCGGVAKFEVKPLYAQIREKKLLTTTEEEDKQAGFPAVQFFIEYTDKEGGHTDSYNLTETVMLGEYTTIGQIYCAPSTMAYQISVWASLGAMGFLLVILYFINIFYSWKIWDMNDKNFATGLVPNDTRFGNVGRFFAWPAYLVASPVTKFIMAILAAVGPYAIACLNVLFYFFVISKGSQRNLES